VQYAAGHQFERDPGRDRLHRQQCDQHEDLGGTGLQRGTAAQQHPDEGARQGHESDRASLVQGRHERLPDSGPAHLQHRIAWQEAERERRLVLAVP
jgi:hypothetical protein